MCPKIAKERKTRMKRLRKIMKDAGCRMIVGYFKFVAIAKLDNKGGKNNSRTSGSAMKKYGIKIST